MQGQKILPGVAYLEMAREAAEKAAGDLEDGQRIVSLRDIVWIRPIAIESEPKEIHIGLYPEESGEISYEIYSKDENQMIHSQGTAILGAEPDIPVLDIKALQAECSLDTVTSEQCYAAFRKIGLDYGEGYQGIKKCLSDTNNCLQKSPCPLFWKTVRSNSCSIRV